MHLPNVFFIYILNCLIFAFGKLPPDSGSEKTNSMTMKNQLTSPCNTCSNLVKSFLKGVDDTSRTSFEGGDAYWEKQNLGSYENSELRFIEIQENLCADLGANKDQCYSFAEIYEQDLENWFFKSRLKNIELFSYLCIDQLKICCPVNTYGPDCVPCPGGIEEPCSGHGICVNGGTRAMPASCSCNIGYTGSVCSDCMRGYYRDTSVSTFVCKVCDKSCKEYCRGPSPKDCEVCSKGYHFCENDGCIPDDSEEILKTDNVSKESERLKTDFRTESAAFETQIKHLEL